MKSMKIPAPPVPPDENETSLPAAEGSADTYSGAPASPYVYPIDPARPGDDDPDWDTFRFPTPPPSWARRKGMPPDAVAPGDNVLPPGPLVPQKEQGYPLDQRSPEPVLDSVLVARFGVPEGSSPSRLESTPDTSSRPAHRMLQEEHASPDDLSARAPRWAAPVQHVSSWHLDLGRMILVHPGRRQKIDLSRVGTRARLVGLCGLLHREPTAEDFRSLWLGLDQACQLAFGMSLPELLASSMEVLVWPGDDWE